MFAESMVVVPVFTALWQLAFVGTLRRGETPRFPLDEHYAAHAALHVRRLERIRDALAALGSPSSVANMLLTDAHWHSQDPSKPAFPDQLAVDEWLVMVCEVTQPDVDPHMNLPLAERLREGETLQLARLLGALIDGLYQGSSVDSVSIAHARDILVDGAALAEVSDTRLALDRAFIVWEQTILPHRSKNDDGYATWARLVADRIRDAIS